MDEIAHKLPPGVETSLISFCERHSLTPRETEILSLVCRGLKNEAIAQRLNLSSPTVRFHLRNLHRKTNTSDKIDVLLRLWHYSTRQEGRALDTSVV